MKFAALALLVVVAILLKPRKRIPTPDEITAMDEPVPRWQQPENVVLLRRLDAWKPGDHDARSLIGWAAAVIRGTLAAELEAAPDEPGGGWER